jgi:hypothetical protein
MYAYIWINKGVYLSLALPHSHLLCENHENDLLFEYVYIKTKSLTFTFSFISNFQCIFKFWFLEGAKLLNKFWNLAAFSYPDISQTLFISTVILSSACFIGCSLRLTPWVAKQTQNIGCNMWVQLLQQLISASNPQQQWSSWMLTNAHEFLLDSLH